MSITEIFSNFLVMSQKIANFAKTNCSLLFHLCVLVRLLSTNKVLGHNSVSVLTKTRGRSVIP